MALHVDSSTVIKDNGRRFSAKVGVQDSNYWEFRYDADNPTAPNTILFDGGKDSAIIVTSTIDNIYLNNVPPEFSGYTASYVYKNGDILNGQFRVNIVFSSTTPVDVAQLTVAVGDKGESDPSDIPVDDILYRITRKDGTVKKSDSISDMVLSRNGARYTFSFLVDEHSVIRDKINIPLTVFVWDIAANRARAVIDENWLLDKDSSIDMSFDPLIMELTPEPNDMLIGENVEGKVLVRISNPNESLRNIRPTLELADGSIGYIDMSTVTFDPETGVTLVYVTNIASTGTVVVNAWIDVANPELSNSVRSSTFVTGSIGPFLVVEDGRKYRFDCPSYVADENYGEFMKFIERFMNSCQYGTDRSSRVSNLEKIARIGEFNDVSRVEPTYLDCYRDQFNFEVTPNLDEYIYYMYYNNQESDDE